MSFRMLAVLLTLALAACGQGTVDPEEKPTQTAPSGQVTPTGTTTAVEQGGIVNVAFWTDPGDSNRSLILGAAGSGGIEFYRPDGERAGKYAQVNAGFVSVLDAVTLGGETSPLIVVYDGDASAIMAFRLNRDSLQLRAVMKEPIHVADELTGLCHYRSPLSGSDYVFAVADGGVTLHYELLAEGAEVAGQLLRNIPTGKDSGFCAVDAEAGMLYISEEAMGIWRLGAEPESDTVREPVDLRAPWGALSDDIKGIGIYRSGPHVSWLVAADVGESRVAVYRLPELDPAGIHEQAGLVVCGGSEPPLPGVVAFMNNAAHRLALRKLPGSSQ